MTDVAKLEARIAELEAALQPFSQVALWDIGADEHDNDLYAAMSPRYAVGEVMRVRHFRAALKAIENDT